MNANPSPDPETQQPAHWDFLGTVILGAVISVVFLVSQILTIIVAAVATKGHLSESELMQIFDSAGKDGFLISISTLATTVVCVLLITGLIKLKNGSVLTEYLAIRPIPRKAMLKWICLLVGFVILSDSMTAFLGRPIVPEFMSAAYATADPVWIIWLALVVAAPLFEETFFRGFLFKGLESSFIGPIGAVLVTSLFWSIIHVQYDAYGIATIFLIGLILGTARAMTGSLLVPMVLHAASNLIATIETMVLS